MLNKIKNNIENELKSYCSRLDSLYSLKSLSPVLLKSIKEFISRDGKRVRPVLFVIGYLGFAKKPAPGLYASALSIELMHDFMLVHDDIIDKSETRRGKPAMHTMFNKYLSRFKNPKFSGEDLTIVAGDVLYAMGIETFLSIKEDPRRKESALRNLIAAAFKTGCGEFIELLYGVTDIDKLKKQDIYKIYDYKTAFYTFAAPLAIGATLAGANKQETDKLIEYGISLGRAFQIKDDILGMFSEEQEIGKSALTDLLEAKRTILVWFAFAHSNAADKMRIKKILASKKAGRKELQIMRRIITASGSLEFAKNEVNQAIRKSEALLAASQMKLAHKTLLKEYSAKILGF